MSPKLAPFCLNLCVLMTRRENTLLCSPSCTAAGLIPGPLHPAHLTPNEVLWAALPYCLPPSYLQFYLLLNRKLLMAPGLLGHTGTQCPCLAGNTAFGTQGLAERVGRHQMSGNLRPNKIYSWSRPRPAILPSLDRAGKLLGSNYMLPSRERSWMPKFHNIQ